MKIKLNGMIIHNVWVYFVIVVLVWFTGNPFITMHGDNLYTFLALFISVICLIIHNLRHNAIIYREPFTIFVTLVILSSLTIMMNISTYELSSWMHLLIQIATGYMFSVYLEFSEFKKKYIKLCVFLGITSLIGYSLSLFFPGIISLFSQVKVSADGWVEYHNAYLYCFMKRLFFAKGTINLVDRNNGIFWEAGVNQAFMNFALLLLLNGKEKLSKVEALQAALLIAVVITTFSSTGFIILLIILLSNFRLFKRFIVSNKRNIVLTLFAFSAFAVCALKFNFFQFRTIEKIIREFTVGDYVQRRVSFDTLQGMFSSVTAWLGVGPGNELLGGNNDSGIIYSFVAYGVPFTLLILYSVYNNMRRNLILPGVGILIFILMNSTEVFLFFPMFMYIVFANDLNMQRRGEYE